MKAGPGWLLLFCMLLLLLVGFDLFTGPDLDSPEEAAFSVPTPDSHARSGKAGKPQDSDIPEPLLPPDDPCLPSIFKGWEELSIQSSFLEPQDRYVAARIVVDLENFHLVLEGIRPDGTVEPVYETDVGVGDPYTPTPQGRFLINHVYCYPDVLFYDQARREIPSLYKGFFAPVLFCDEEGSCKRFGEHYRARRTEYAQRSASIDWLTEIISRNGWAFFK